MQTTYNLVKNALDPIYEWAKFLDYSDAKQNYVDGSGLRTAAIRLDVETSSSGTYEQSISGAFSQIRDELMDMVTNGDRSNIQDALLNTLDGEVKIGKHLSKINISHARIYREFRPTRDSFEYTFFMTVYVEFERS